MTQEFLDDGDLDLVLQAVGGERVTQTMDAPFVGKAGFVDSAIENILAGAFGHRFESFGAWEEPMRRTGLQVILAENHQEIFAEESEALVAALGMRDQQTMTVPVQILDANVGGLGQAQASAIDGGKKSLGAEITGGAGGQERFHLGHAVRARDAGGPFGALDLGEQGLDVAGEQSAVESAEGIDGDVDSGRGELTLGDQMIQPAFDLLGVELIGTLVIELGQGIDETDVRMDGALGLAVEPQILNETLA